LLAGLCMEQQSVQKEHCDGYASSLVSASCGVVAGRCVYSPPPMMSNREGVFSGRVVQSYMAVCVSIHVKRMWTWLMEL
jgi:hypothetical protein